MDYYMRLSVFSYPSTFVITIEQQSDLGYQSFDSTPGNFLIFNYTGGNPSRAVTYSSLYSAELVYVAEVGSNTLTFANQACVV